MPPIKKTPADTAGAASGDSAESTQQAEERTGPSIWVRSVSEKGRRRSGLAFSPEPQRVWLEDLSKAEQKAIADDPHLISRLHDDD